MDKMNKFKPITGDDLPTFSIALRELPRGYHFKDLTIPARATKTLIIKDRLFNYCEKYYRNHEIVGVTVGDWFNDMQLCIDRNVDNFEKFLDVYDDDIAKPTLGREIEFIHTETETANGKGESVNKNYDLPIDNPNAEEVERITQNNESDSTRKIEYSDLTKQSDVGVTDNWVKLNGFLNENPTLEIEFSRYFKDCFMILEVITWRLYSLSIIWKAQI